MKHSKVLLMGLLVGVFSLLGVVAANAQTFRSGTNIVTEDSETISSSLYIAGSSVDVRGTVEGDVYCAGQSVTISANVEGDVICAAQTLLITGNVSGDIRTAGQSVLLEGQVDGNVTVFAQSFTLASGHNIDRDLSGAVATTVINGSVGRDLAIASEKVSISGEIGRNILGEVTTIELLGNASVGGDINYTSDNEIAQSSNAVVMGEIVRQTPSKNIAEKNGAVFGFSLGWFIFWLLAMLCTALALVLIFPLMFHRITDRGLPTPLKAFLVGLAASVIAPILFVVLLVTVVGIPLAFILGLMWLVICLLSGPITAYYIGRWLLKDSRNPLLIMLSGASLLLVSYFIPIIGFITLIFAFWLGSGMLLLEFLRRTPKPVYVINETKTQTRHVKKK